MPYEPISSDTTIVDVLRGGRALTIAELDVLMCVTATAVRQRRQRDPARYRRRSDGVGGGWRRRWRAAAGWGPRRCCRASRRARSGNSRGQSRRPRRRQHCRATRRRIGAYDVRDQNVRCTDATVGADVGGRTTGSVEQGRDEGGEDSAASVPRITAIVRSGGRPLTPHSSLHVLRS